jgi:hypothetical protein
VSKPLTYGGLFKASIDIQRHVIYWRLSDAPYWTSGLQAKAMSAAAVAAVSLTLHTSVKVCRLQLLRLI